MAREVKLPRLGQGMESGTVVKWFKGEGDAVEKGQPLYELDTDKVTQEVEAEASGVLLKIVVPEGEVPVGTTLAFIGEAGEEVEAPKTEEAPPEEPLAEPEPTGRGRRGGATAQNGGTASASRPRRSRGGSRVSRASISRPCKGTGPDGRIVAEDVERLAPGAAPAAAPRRA